VNGFEADLEDFVNHADNADGNDHADLKKRVVALSSGTAAVHLGLLAAGVKAGDEVDCTVVYVLCFYAPCDVSGGYAGVGGFGAGYLEY